MKRVSWHPPKRKSLGFISGTFVSVLLIVSVVIMAFQNCSKGGFETLEVQTLESLHDHSGHVHQPSTSVGRDPDYAEAGAVSYGLFNKIPRANAVIPEGQLGKAVIIRLASKTYVSAMAIGLQPNKSYMAHVHADTCANGAGGHYKKDPTVTTAVESNEVWLKFDTDAEGNAHARVEVPYVVGVAPSLVIHNLDGAKFYCADFVSQEVPTPLSKWSSGFFAPMPSTKAGVDIKGNATKVVLSNGMTGFRITVWGLTPGQNYPVHVHNYACSAGAGMHFMIDPNQPMTQANEAWLPLTASAAGTAANEIWISQVNQTTNSEALSIVIHDPADATKQACADLVQKPSGLAISGLFQLTDATVGKKLLLSNISAAEFGASVEYSTNTQAAPNMKVRASVFGLPAGNYVGHVHNRPCRKAAGGHYFIDMGFGKVQESNEVWVRLTVANDSTGVVNINAPIAMRADAMSLVVHDFVDSSKMICADLL